MMKSVSHLRLSFALILLLAGCNRGQPTNRVARQASAPAIVNDSRLDVFVGDWTGDDGTVELSITRNPDGTATICVPPNQAWDAVVNNARYEGQTLRYDLYFYYKGSADFHTISNTTGDHPYSGVRNEIILTPTGSNKMGLKLVTKDVPNGKEENLRRNGPSS